MRYEAVIGFNTKQPWIYDNENDIYIDPPVEVLSKLPDWRVNSDMTTMQLELIANKNPDWLNDKEYWWNGEI